MRGLWFRRFGLGTVALATAMTVPADARAQDAGEAPATVRVVHGLRGLVADVYLDGVLALPTFQPERATDPLTIPAGDHLVEVRTAGAPMTAPPELSRTITAPAGFVGSVVAHLDSAGAPTLTVFADDLTAVPAGQTRVVVRHAAASGAVDILVDDRPAVVALAPATEASPVVSPGEHRLSFAPASSPGVLGMPQRVAFGEGAAQFVYLIGSQAEGTLGWAAVQVTDLQTPPAMIQTGDGSALGDDPGGDVLPLVPLAGALALVLVAAGLGALRTARPEG